MSLTAPAYEVLVHLANVTGVSALVRRQRRGQAAILMYHGVTDQPPERLDDPKLHIAVGLFRRHLELLKRRFTVIPLADAMDREGVCITFDDGYANVVRCALPVLRELGLPATLFVTAGLVGSEDLQWTDLLGRVARTCPMTAPCAGVDGGLTLTERNLPHALAHLKALPNDAREAFVEALSASAAVDPEPGESRIVSEADLRAWADAGLEVGSHGLTHPILPKITDGDELTRELAESKRRLEEVGGRPVTQFAYPNGDVDDRVKRRVAEAGYDLAVSVYRAHVPLGRDRLALPRYNAGRASVARLYAMVCGIEAELLGIGQRLGIWAGERQADGTRP